MAGKEPVELGEVQKTMLFPLWGRAFESTKPNPLLVDRAAVEILGQLDYDFASVAATQNPMAQLAWILRAACTDEALLGFLTRHPGATVVNLGCGLDTTFERVDNGRLRWYDLDLPDVIELRSKLVGHNSRRTMIAASFLDESWPDQIEVAESAFFIAAGLFYYFDQDQIRTFLHRLTDQFPGAEILFDVASPMGVQVANKQVIEAGGLTEGAYLQWGLENTEDLLEWDDRMSLVNTYFYFAKRVESLPEDQLKLGRMSDRLRIQYLVHLALQPAESAAE